MNRHFQNSDAAQWVGLSRILCMREILFAYFCIFLSESVCLFPGIVLR